MADQLPASFIPDTPAEKPAAAAALPASFVPDTPAGGGGRMNFAIVNGVRMPVGRDWADTATDLLPAAGGAVGGIVGGAGGTVAGMGIGGVPGAVGGSAVGGAAGEAVRQLINMARGKSAPSTSEDAAKDIGESAAVQAASQLAGEGLAKGASYVTSKAAPWLMHRALDLTDKLAREFPSISTTMIDHALTVTKGGLDRARTLLTAAKGRANAALTTAHAAGAEVPITAATNGLTDTLSKVANSADVEGGLQALASIEHKVQQGRPSLLTPMAADALKESLQTQSRVLYTALKAGQGKPNTTVQAQALADMARSLNVALSDITTRAGAPGYRAANSEASELIGAVRGITRGVRAGNSPIVAMVRPLTGAVVGAATGAGAGGAQGGALGALTGATTAALLTPAGLSRLAVAITRPGVAKALKQAPRLAEAVSALLAAGAPGTHSPPR